MNTSAAHPGRTRHVFAVALAAALASVPALAQVLESGTLAAAIRTAGHPCAHVISAAPIEGPGWRVQCNAGEYKVKDLGGGNFDVAPL